MVTIDRKKIAIPLAAILVLLAVAGWGISQYYMKKQLQLQAENQYELSFNNLLWHVDNVQLEVTKALASNSPDQLLKLTANIWRESFSAKQSLAHLPLNFLELNNTERFLNQINEFSFFLSQQSGERKTLDDQEWQTLQKFHTQIKNVNNELQSLSSRVATRKFQWNELAQRAAGQLNGSGLPTNIMTQGFLKIDQQIQKRPELIYEGSVLDFKPDPRAVTGKEITRAEAIASAKRQLPKQMRGRRVSVTGENRGNIAAYTLLAAPATPIGTDLYLDVTKKGGHVLWFFTDRKVETKTKNLKEAEKIASDFVNSMEFENMKVVYGEIEGNMASISLAFETNNIYRYTDMIRVKVALDNGEILGYDARNYFTFHCPDGPPEPKLTAEEARAKVNTHLDIKRQRLVITLNESFEEVLVYEFLTKLDTDNVYVYINALTGNEERIERRVIAPSEDLIL